MEIIQSYYWFVAIFAATLRVVLYFIGPWPWESWRQVGGHMQMQWCDELEGVARCLLGAGFCGLFWWLYLPVVAWWLVLRPLARSWRGLTPFTHDTYGRHARSMREVADFKAEYMAAIEGAAR